jgi:hypothetical protein
LLEYSSNELETKDTIAFFIKSDIKRLAKEILIKYDITIAKNPLHKSKILEKKPSTVNFIIIKTENDNNAISKIVLGFTLFLLSRIQL